MRRRGRWKGKRLKAKSFNNNDMEISRKTSTISTNFRLEKHTHLVVFGAIL